MMVLSKSKARRGLFMGALTASMLLGGCYVGGAEFEDEGADEGGDDGEAERGRLIGPGTCVDTDKFFKQNIWTPVLSKKCIGCHNPDGVAGNTDLVLQMSDYPGYLEANQQTVQNVARLSIDGMPLLLAKPAGLVEHGGGLQMPEGSEEYELLGEMIERFAAPSHCRDDADINQFFAGITDLDEEQTLRKAVFLLANRMPTAEELDAVRDAGIDSLDEVLDAVLYEDAFYGRAKEIVNDMLHTDAYRIGDDAVETVDEDMFPTAFWFDDIEDNDLKAQMRNLANEAIAREPLEIVEHVLRNDRPFTEVFTGDYTIINPYSARSYGIPASEFENYDDPNEKIAWNFEEIPQAGLLTTSVFLNRYPTTPTNRNRARSRFFFKFFLATDMMRLAARPLDATEIQSHNPTLNVSACNVCHNNMDPVAGAFMNWDGEGRYRPMEEGWFGDMVPPGFSGEEMPFEEYERGVQWLAEQMTSDTKFSLSMVHLVFTGLTGQDPLEEPMELEDADYLARIRAYEAQDHVFKQIAEKFVTSNYDLRVVFKELVKSHYFRAVSTEEALDDQRTMELADMGTARLLPPEALGRRIEATLGMPWVKNGVQVLNSGDYYKFFYGGIDSVSVTDRLTEMNGVMANVVERMSNEMSCNATALDFTRPAEERLLFPEVELSDLPGPGSEDAIRANLVYMYSHLLGERLDADDPEVDRAYGILTAVWEDGQQGLMLPEEPYPVALPGPCRADGEEVPAESQIVDDPDYIVRAWMAVTTYMLGDYRYLYE